MQDYNRYRYPSPLKIALTKLANAFAALVIVGTLGFIVVDTAYLIIRYAPKLVKKVRSWIYYKPEAIPDDGTTIDLPQQAQQEEEDDD